MSTDNWFAALTFLAVYVVCLLMLDGAHKAHIAALKAAHREQVASLRSYIRTLSRERMWLEAEVQRLGDKAKRNRQFDYIVGGGPLGAPFVGNGKVRSEPEHIEWLPTLPPSEEYGEGE